MTKYKIILHDYTLKGTVHAHKKSGMSYQSMSYCDYNNEYIKEMIFDSSYAAKLFILYLSSFPKFDLYLLSHPDEKILDKAIAKGGYSLKYRYNIRLPENLQGSLLCEFAIIEVEDV